MYGYLLPRLGQGPAVGLTALWYAALVIAIAYCAFEPQAEFKYLML
jgi:hypothetical protein